MIRLLKYIFFLLLALFAIVSILLQFESVQNKAIVALENKVFEATGMHIGLSHVSLDFPATIAVHNIEVKDHTNTLFLKMSRVDLKLNLRQILEWKIPAIKLDVHHANL